MLIQIVIIIILFIITYSRNIIKKLHKLLDFYHDNYFPIKEYLSKKELDYINNIILYSPLDIWNMTMEGKRLSFISFSHEYNIEEDEMTHGRFACGSILNYNMAFTDALDILKERNIVIPEYLVKRCRFGGLGWDFNKNNFKIYFRFFNKKVLKNIYFTKKYSKEIKNLGNKYWEEGIISLTYNQNKIIEEKVYLYPKYKDFKNNHETIMICSKRGIIKQIDIHDKNEHNYEKIDNLINQYKEDNIDLDTISKHKNKITIYFPK